MRKLTALAVACVAVLGGSVSAFGQAGTLVAEIDFSLTPGPAHGTSSGFGFTAWDTQNGNTSSYAIHTSGLSYAGLASSGNSLVGAGSYLGGGIGLNTSTTLWAPYVQTGGGTIGKDGTTLWGSMLVNQFVETEDFALQLHDSGIRWSAGSPSINVGISNGRFTLGHNGVTTVNTNVRRIPGQTNLLVFKFEFLSAGTDRVTLYINPTVGGATPDVPGTVLNTSGNVQFRSIRFYPNQNNLTGGLDALRFGSSFQAVTPAASTTVSTQRPNRAYFVGNSVTDTINQERLRQMALGTGRFMPWGRQMIPGSPLELLWNSPNNGFTNAPYNYPQTAFTNAEWSWDSIVLQPFDRQLASDLDYAQRFIDLAKSNPANTDTQFYVYSRWPRKDADGSLDYQAKWLCPYTGNNGTEETKAYFEQLLTGLRNQNPVGKPILMVPVGDVLFELDRRMEAGQVPGYTDVSQLYVDGIHFGNDGSYIVGLTFYATLFRADPRGLNTNPWNTTGTPISPALDAAFKQVVFDIVSVHPYAGYQRVVVPEPASLGLLAPTSLLLLRRRRAA